MNGSTNSPADLWCCVRGKTTRRLRCSRTFIWIKLQPQRKRYRCGWQTEFDCQPTRSTGAWWTTLPVLALDVCRGGESTESRTISDVVATCFHCPQVAKDEKEFACSKYESIIDSAAHNPLWVLYQNKLHSHEAFTRKQQCCRWMRWSDPACT